MRSRWVVLALIVVGIVGLGFYRGWFSFGSHSDADKSNITLTVDDHKIQADRKEATQKVEDLGRSAKDTVTGEKN